MSAAVARALHEPSVRERLLRIGADLNPLGPAEFGALLREEDARWTRAARDGLIVRAQ